MHSTPLTPGSAPVPAGTTTAGTSTAGTSTAGTSTAGTSTAASAPLDGSAATQHSTAATQTPAQHSSAATQHGAATTQHGAAAKHSTAATQHGAAAAQTPAQWAEQTAAEMTGTDQISHVLHAISTYLECSAAVFTALGDPLSSVGTAPAQLIGRTLATTPGLTTTTIGAWRIHIYEHKTINLSFILTLAAKQPLYPSAEFLQAAELLLSTALGIANNQNTVISDAAKQLLQALEQGIHAAQENSYWQRLNQFHFNRSEGLRLLAVCNTGKPAKQLRKELIAAANSSEFPLLLGVDMLDSNTNSEIHILTSDDSRAQELLQQNCATSLVGVSGEIRGLTQLPFAVTEAELALNVTLERAAALPAALPATLPATDFTSALLPGSAATSHTTPAPSSKTAHHTTTPATHTATPATHTAHAHRLVRYDELHLVDWLRWQASRHKLRPRITDFLGELRGKPEYLETVITYLALSLNTNAAAKALHIHPNTVRYRLEKAAELLGAETIHEPFIMADLIACLSPQLHAVAAQHSRAV